MLFRSEHWIYLVPDRDQWRDFVNKETKFWVWDNIKLAVTEKVCKAEHWMYLVPDRDQWRFLINTVIKLCVLHV